ncbi:MAG TPA: FtsX-like permease family protein [Candidatus Limnocylindria bacterium]|nr:FtsX-like permease family protein [Candidatus Limnocylindria bacterium]
MRLATLAWRGLLARPLRTALTVAGVAFGVAVLAATIVIGSSSERALQGLSADLLGRADVRLRAFEEAGFTPRTLQAIRADPNVVAAAPVAQRRLTAYTAPGEGERVFSVMALGIEPAADAEVRPPSVVSGRALDPDAADEVLVPAAFAARNGLGLGSEVRLDGRREGLPPLRIVGLLRDTGLGAVEGGDVIVLARSTLDDSFAVPAPVRAVDVDLGENPTSAEIDRLTALLDEPYVVETPEDAARGVAGAQTAFGQVALLFGLVALVVGAFLVGNTLAMTVSERTRELGLLRAAGTTSRQVLGIVLRQAAAIGLVGSAAGVLLGLLLATLLAGLVSSTRAVLLTGLVVPPVGMIVAFLLGLAATLLGAAFPAARAARLSPLDALRPSRRPERGLLERLRPLILLEVAAVLIGLVVTVVVGGGSPVLPILLSLALLIGGALAAAFVLEPLGRLIGRPFEWFFGAQGLLGRASLTRDRARTGLTVGAMMIALAAVVALGTVAESARAGTERWVDSILPGGHAIRTSLPLDVETFRPTIEATAGLRVASPLLEVPVIRVDGDTREEAIVVGIDPNVFQDNRALVIRDGRRAAAFSALRAGGGVLVPAALADRAGIAAGDTLLLGVPGGQAHEMTVAGVVEYTLPARTPDGALLVGSADARDLFGATTASLWVLVPQPTIGDAAFASAVRETALQLAAEPLTAADLARDLSRSLDSLTGLLDVLALVAVAIAALGIVNTLGIGVQERIREIAILRSHGMTVGQVQAMIVTEATIMGAVAGVLAVATGVVVASALVNGGVATQLDAGVRLPWALLIAVVLTGAGIAALSGLYPARAAAKLPIVGSLKHFE